MAVIGKLKKIVSVPILILTAGILFFYFYSTTRAAACAKHNIKGWAWSANIGWISLSCENTVGPEDYGLDINYSSGVFTSDSYAWSEYLGWVSFAPTGPYPVCGNCPNYAARYSTSTGKLSGWAKVIGSGDDGWIKLGPFTVGDYDARISSNRTLSGWGWNADNAGIGAGAGWISFSSANPETALGEPAYLPEFNPPYFKGEGDIYSKGGVATFFKPPTGQANATFLIHANGTISPTVVSLAGPSTPYIDPAYPSIDFPQSSNEYANILGKLDRAGLISGKYGSVTSIPSGGGVNCSRSQSVSTSTLGTTPTLNAGVYYVKRNLVIDQPFTIETGVGTNKGRGTIMIDCDLVINANITYSASSLTTSIEQLPSVAWIVRGNIIVNPSVTNIAGVFYTEGAQGFLSGTTNNPKTDQKLDVSGLIMAKKFQFQRLYFDPTGNPSERVMYDGRVWLNTPPGLEDIIKGLPIFKEVTP